MSDKIRFVVGIMGNAASLLLYAAPMLTFTRVIKKGNTEEFSSIPYVIALFNCLLYTWYGLPVVSNQWENVPVFTINGVGILLEISFIIIYLWYAVPYQKKMTLLMAVPVVVLFILTALISRFILHDHPHRKVLVGSIGLVASMSMYSSPLVAVRQVIRSKSVEYMPFYLSFFSFAASTLWLFYGLLGHDIFLAAPNFIGSPMGILQLVLYFIYRNGSKSQEPLKMDLEKNGVKSHQVTDQKLGL
ncbi:nodulin MtN3 family protein isoform X2 [Carex rostrata]